MIKKKKNKINIIEIWFKKYQTSISIIIPTLISTAALIISINANKFSESQAKKALIPNWDYKIVNEQDNELQQIQFVSLKSDFKIDNLEILTPFKDTNNNIYSTHNDFWNLHNFQAKLLDTFLTLYKVNSTLNSDIIPIAGYYEDALPIIVRVNYIYNNEKGSTITLYKLTFRIYENQKLRVKAISYVNALHEAPISTYNNMLSYINKTDYLGLLDFSVSDELLDDIKQKDSSIYSFIKWTILAEEKINVVFNLNDTSGFPINSIELIQPLVFYGEKRKIRELKYRDSILSTVNYDRIAILKYNQKIDSFLQANPTCDTSYYYLLQKSNWNNITVYNNWIELLRKIRIDIWKLFYPLYK